MPTGKKNEIFWAFTDFVFTNQGEISSDNLSSKVGQFVGGRKGVDVIAFHACLQSLEPDSIILRDENSGFLNSVRSTPTLFVDGQKIVGFDEDRLQRMLQEREALLKQAGLRIDEHDRY